MESAEARALHAAMDNDSDELEEAVHALLPSERRDLIRACRVLVEELYDHIECPTEGFACSS